MSFLWQHHSTSDCLPEETRRIVQAQAEAYFTQRSRTKWKPGPAARALSRGIQALPEDTQDFDALSWKQRLRMQSLQAAAMREHQELFHKRMAVRKVRPKKHSGLVRVPRCLTPPYNSSLSFTTPNLGSGFAERDGELPQQPNSQPILTDTVNGLAGQTMVWDATASTAFLDVTRGVLIGGWIQADNTTPPILAAYLTAVSFADQNFSGNGCVTEGWVYLFGGGIAAYQLSTKLFVFTATSQIAGIPPAPVMTASSSLVDLSFPQLQVFRTVLPAGTKTTPNGVASAVGRGTWMLVLAGPVVRFFASVSHADWSMGVDTTWSVDKICCYW
jgi:hypothetical protein